MNQNQMNYEEAVEMLHSSGFSTQEINLLCKLRRAYADGGEMDQAALDLRRLHFARWLVETGKLTDQLD
jgi:hypothetical protein